MSSPNLADPRIALPLMQHKAMAAVLQANMQGVTEQFEKAKSGAPKQAVLYGVIDAAKMLTQAPDQLDGYMDAYEGCADNTNPTHAILRTALISGLVESSQKMLRSRPIEDFDALAANVVNTPMLETLALPLWQANSRQLKMIEAIEAPESPRHRYARDCINMLRPQAA